MFTLIITARQEDLGISIAVLGMSGQKSRHYLKNN
jgi:hypothetical protein